MIQADPTGPILLHAPGPERDGLIGADVLRLPDVPGPGAMADMLDTAGLLVVDDAMQFPFEALGDPERDIPVVVRLPVTLDAAGIESVLGVNLLDHLTPCDVVAGDRELIQALRHRRLPVSRWIGGRRLTVEQLVNRGRRWNQQLRERFQGGPSHPGWPLTIAVPDPARERQIAPLRAIKAKFRAQRDVLRSILAELAAKQPPIRPMHGALFARQPTVWASVWPPELSSWVGVELLPEPDDLDDLGDKSAALVSLPAHMRLPMSPFFFDVAVIVADVMHNPRHSVHRLFEESARLIRPGGWLVVLATVVVDDQRDSASRPVPLSASELVDLAGQASGRCLVLSDVQALRPPGEQHHMLGAFVLQSVRTRPRTHDERAAHR